MRWRANPAVVLKDWGEELVVFCETTGNTHLLDHNGASIFLTLQAGESDLSLSELGGQLAEDDANMTALLTALEGQLEELQLLDLVYRTTA